MTARAIVLRGSEWLVADPMAVRQVALALRFAEAENSRRNGISSSLLRDLAASAADAAALGSASEPAELPGGVAVSVSGASETVSVMEAHQMLGVSEEYVRRLCRTGELETAAQPVQGGPWRIDRAEVAGRVALRAAS